jgi:hypothetical protein
MTATTSTPRILLVDDGELEPLAGWLDARDMAYERLRGGGIPAEVAPPLDLLVVTPRHVDRVRRGSPAGAGAGRPLRIIAAPEDSPSMRRRVRRAGMHLLVRLPAQEEIWRLLIARALYQGEERRGDERVAVGSPVGLAVRAPTEASETILVDLSNRGCRLRTPVTIGEGEPIAFTLPAGLEATGDAEPLTLHGRVRRVAAEAGSSERALAVVFDPAMPESDRTRLTALINRWASGPSAHSNAPVRDAMPAIPPCRLPTLPELMLDDETDPPIAAHSEVCVRLADREPADPTAGAADRRAHPRGRFESSLLAESDTGRIVLIGRDLSAGGMRIERFGRLAVGDRIRIALHGPTAGEPFLVQARVARDDGPDGYALVFEDLDAARARTLEKLVACLPDVESLEEGELGGLGAILSEVQRDT